MNNLKRKYIPTEFIQIKCTNPTPDRPFQGNHEFVDGQSSSTSKGNLVKIISRVKPEKLEDETTPNSRQHSPEIESSSPTPEKQKASTYENFVSSNWNNLYPRKIVETCITLGLESTDDNIRAFWTSNRHFFEDLMKNCFTTGMLELIVREIQFGIEHLEVYFRGIDIGREMQKRKVNEVLQQIKHQLENLEGKKMEVARNHGEQTARVSNALKFADQFTKTSGRVTDAVEKKLSAKSPSTESHQQSASELEHDFSESGTKPQSQKFFQRAVDQKTSPIPNKKRKMDIMSYEYYINSNWNGVYEEILEACISLGLKSNDEGVHSFWENYQYLIRELVEISDIDSLLRTIVDEIPYGIEHLKTFFRGIEIGKDIESPNALKAVGKGASDFVVAVEQQLTWCQETVSQTIEQSKQIARVSVDKMESTIVKMDIPLPKTQITPSFVVFHGTCPPVQGKVLVEKLNGAGCFEHVKYDLTVEFNCKYLISVTTSDARLMELKELIGCLLPATQVILNKDIEGLAIVSDQSPGWIVKCKAKLDGFKFINFVGPIKLCTHQWRLKKNVNTVVVSAE